VTLLVVLGVQSAEAETELNRKVVGHVWAQPRKGTTSDGQVQPPPVEILTYSQDYGWYGGHEERSTFYALNTPDGQDLTRFLSQSGCDWFNPVTDYRPKAFRFWSQERDENGKDITEEIPPGVEVPPGQIYSEVYPLRFPSGQPNPNCPALLIENKRYTGLSNDGPGHLSWQKGGLTYKNHKWIPYKAEWIADQIEFAYQDGPRVTFVKNPHGTDYECDRNVLHQDGCSWFNPEACTEHDPEEPLCTPP